MDLTPVEILVAGMLVFSGTLVQTTLGFGLGIVAAPLLILIHPELVPGPILFVAIWLSALNVWANRTGLAFGELGVALVGRIPGTLVAMAVLLVATPRLLNLLLGASVLLGVYLSYRIPYIERTRARLFGAGLLSGFMTTTTSVGGPPMALIYQSATGKQARANLAAYFLVGTVGSLIALILIGRFTAEHLRISLMLVIPAVLGFLLARPLLPLINPAWVRPGLLVLCTISGSIAMLKGVLGS